MQSFSRDPLPVDAGHPRATAVAVADFRGGVSEGHLSRQNGRSLRKPPPAALGGKCKYIVFGCSRSAEISYRSILITLERLVSPSSTFSKARANVKFRSGPVAR